MTSEFMKIYEYLSKKGIKVSREKLEETLIKFIMNREEELIEMIKEEESDEMLKKWLETPVETEKTDIVKEPNTVI